MLTKISSPSMYSYYKFYMFVYTFLKRCNVYMSYVPLILQTASRTICLDWYFCLEFLIQYLPFLVSCVMTSFPSLNFFFFFNLVGETYNQPSSKQTNSSLKSTGSIELMVHDIIITKSFFFFFGN